MCFNTNEEKENINLMIRLDLKLNGVTALFDSQKLKLLWEFNKWKCTEYSWLDIWGRTSHILTIGLLIKIKHKSKKWKGL